MRMESTRKKREFFAWIVIYNVNDTAFSLVQFFRQNSWIANLLPGSGPVYLNQQNWEKFPSVHSLTF